MNNFNWALDLTIQIDTAKKDSYVYLVDYESKLSKMTEYKDAKIVIDNIISKIKSGD